MLCARSGPFGGGNVMVWGAFNGPLCSRLMVVQGNLTAAGYRDQVLIPELLPFMAAHGPGLTFQHDNARPHMANLTWNFHRNAASMSWSGPQGLPTLIP